jgi:uncharacterized protein YbjT (DUF2867 family)
MEKIIVLGATGTIGKAVLAALQPTQTEVYAGVRNPENVSASTLSGAVPIQLDFTKAEDLDRGLQGMDRVFLVTPLMQQPEWVTQLVLEAAKKNNIKHIVRSTALGADVDGAIEMSRWAGRSEERIKAAGIPYTFIRPNNFLENFINFHAQTIREYKGFYVPNGTAKVGMVSVADIAEVAVHALTSDAHMNKAYDLSGLALTNAEYAAALSEVLAEKISYIDVPEAKAKESMLSNGMPEWLVSAMMELYSIMKQGWTAAYSDDFKKVTGREYTTASSFFEKNKQVFQSV